ncbi:MAG: hypothetical protein ACLQRH_08795 [Acidimicrobiales bacterium]
MTSPDPRIPVFDWAAIAAAARARHGDECQRHLAPLEQGVPSHSDHQAHLSRPPWRP